MYIAVDSVLNSVVLDLIPVLCHYFSGFRSHSCEMETDVGGFFRVSMKLVFYKCGPCLICRNYYYYNVVSYVHIPLVS